MKLNEMTPSPGSHRKFKRVGRGIGSTKGKTAGRGVKGQKARTGVALNGFEGGQMPIHRRLPKRGFNNPSARRFAEVGLEDLQAAVDAKALDAAKPVTAAALKEAGVVTHVRDGVRILANGALKAKLTIEVSGASRAAIAAIEAAGGTIKVDRLPGTREKRPPKGSRGRKLLRNRGPAAAGGEAEPAR